VCYKIRLGTDCTTVPGRQATHDDPRASEAAGLFYVLAHMTDPPIRLFKDGTRIDELWTDRHRQALRDFRACLPAMRTRYLQPDGRAVIWHDAARTCATIWCFANRAAALPGRVKDITAGATLPKASRYRLRAGNVYEITGVKALPVRL